MASLSPGHRAFDTSGVIVAATLLSLYVLLGLYGVLATAVGIPTFQMVTGEVFELLWPIGIALGSLLSAYGVRRSWRTGSLRFEMLMTAFLVLWLDAYTVALLIRAFLEPAPSDYALACLPLGFSAVPAIRVLVVHYRLDRAREDDGEDEAA